MAAAGGALAVLVLGAAGLLAGEPGGARPEVARSAPPPGLPAELPLEVRECAVCHMNPGLRLAYRDSTGALHRGYIDPEAYVRSIHFRRGRQECTSCHEGDFSSYPHHVEGALPTCLDCHEEYQQEYRSIESAAHGSVHFASGRSPRFQCGTCHSPHGMRPAREMTLAQRNGPCRDCHEGRYNPSGLTLAQRHDWHPQAALHLGRIACIDCHTQPAGTDYAFRHEILPASEATADCYACHGQETKMAAYGGGFVGGRAKPYTRDDLVRDYYLSGGTRFAPLDRLWIGLALLAALGAGAHGLLRWTLRRRRSP